MARFRKSSTSSSSSIRHRRDKWLVVLEEFLKFSQDLGVISGPWPSGVHKSKERLSRCLEDLSVALGVNQGYHATSEDIDIEAIEKTAVAKFCISVNYGDLSLGRMKWVQIMSQWNLPYDAIEALKEIHSGLVPSRKPLNETSAHMDEVAASICPVFSTHNPGKWMHRFEGECTKSWHGDTGCGADMKLTPGDAS